VIGLKLRKLAAGLSSKRNRRALRHGVAPSIEHSRCFRHAKYNTVVDIGANRGQFALFARALFPRAKIVAFEPLSPPAAIFSMIFADDPLTRLHNVGIGPGESAADMYVAAADDSSSLLKPSARASAAFGTTVARLERVKLVRLASVLSASEIVAPALLKLDVQGFERDALLGCTDLLPHFDHVYAEISFVPLYERQPLAGAIIGWLNDRGFELRGVFNQFIDPLQGPIQADALFARRAPAAAAAP